MGSSQQRVRMSCYWCHSAQFSTVPARCPSLAYSKRLDISDLFALWLQMTSMAGKAGLPGDAHKLRQMINTNFIKVTSHTGKAIRHNALCTTVAQSAAGDAQSCGTCLCCALFRRLRL